MQYSTDFSENAAKIKVMCLPFHMPKCFHSPVSSEQNITDPPDLDLCQCPMIMIVTLKRDVCLVTCPVSQVVTCPVDVINSASGAWGRWGTRGHLHHWPIIFIETRAEAGDKYSIFDIP